MRRFDKLKNLHNANLLAEHRYLEDKSGMNEMGLKPKREIIWRAPSKFSKSGELLAKFGDRGEYLGSENGEEVVSFNKNFYTSEGTFEFVDKGHGSQEDFIKSIYGDGGLNEYEDNYIPQDGSDGGEMLNWEVMDAYGDTIYPGTRRPGDIEDTDIILFSTTRGDGRISVGDFESQGGDRYDHNTYSLLLSLLADGSAESL